MNPISDTTTTRLTQTLAVALAMLTVFSMVGGVASAAGSTAISVTPADQTLTPGETTTVQVVLDDADSGVGAGQIGLQVSDPSVAEITDVTVENDPGNQNTNVAADGASATTTFAFADSADTGSVTVLTVTLEGQATGSTDISVVPPSDVSDDNLNLVFADEFGAEYSVSSTSSASVAVVNEAPTANAGTDQTVTAGDSVTLDATGSTDPEGDTLSYSWIETSNAGMTLAAADTAQPTFTAPDVDSETELSFEVAVTDSEGQTDTDTVSVTVTPDDEPASSMESSVSLSPTSSETFVGGTTTYDLVVDNAQGGVGAYEATIALDDPSIASITDVELQGSPAGQTKNIDIADDGSSVTITAALMDTTDTGSVSVASVTVTGDAAGSTDLTTSVDALGNEAGNGYTVTDTQGASLSVTEKSTSVSLSPTSDELSVDDTTTYDVVIDNAEGGVGAYSATVAVTDPSVASITDVELQGSPAESTSNADIAADGSSVAIDAALMDTEDTGSVTVATITVAGDAAGSTDLSASVDALADEDGRTYTVTETTGASVTVTEVTVGNFANPVNDVDDDGKYEDINGDGTFNIIDIQALFANLDDASVESNQEKFDFNNSGTVNVVDVQALFNELISG